MLNVDFDKDGELISIIVPIFNSEKYLPKCIDSIINQTYDKIEIILIDDGSTDHSLAICRDYENKDKRIKVYSKKNEGLPKTREFGLINSTGQLILFVDSDDYINKDLCLKCIKAFHEVDCDFVWFNFYVENDNNIKKNNIILQNEWTSTKEMMFLTSKNKNTDFLWCKIFKRKCFDKVEFSKFNLYEDAFLFIQIILNSEKACLLKDYLYYYVQHIDSMVRSLNYSTVSGGVTNLIFKLEKINTFSHQFGFLYSDQCADLLFRLAIKFKLKEFVQLSKMLNKQIKKESCKVKKISNFVFLNAPLIAYLILKPLYFARRFLLKKLKA